jgi:RNA cap guanine-N2 methyltransferase
MQADAIFVSPPWGGPSYSSSDVFDIEAMKPYSAYVLALLILRLALNSTLTPKTFRRTLRYTSLGHQMSTKSHRWDLRRFIICTLQRNAKRYAPIMGTSYHNLIVNVIEYQYPIYQPAPLPLPHLL